MIARKHFQAIANSLRDVKPLKVKGVSSPADISIIQWKRDVDALISAFTSLNERFDAQRFREACGYEFDCASCKTA